jgi:hypothetical protein
LVEQYLRASRAPCGPLYRDFVRITAAELGARLAELPEGLTRISVGRFRERIAREDPDGVAQEYAQLVELGGFLVHGLCELTEIARRFGAGDYRVTAYQIDPPTLLWEVIATVRAST